MYRYLIGLIFCLLIGCQKNCNDQCTRFHDDGRAKPILTIVPMLDSTSYDVPWSISEEFTNNITTNLSKLREFYLTNTEIHLSSEDNPFGSNLSWVKSNFHDTEFVVFLELVQHEDVPLVKSVKEPEKILESRRDAANLNMAIRMRIIDVRSDSPKIVLQEMIKDCYYMANNIDKPNYSTITWGSEEYKTTPLALAHSQIIKLVEERINDYVMLAKSR